MNAGRLHAVLEDIREDYEKNEVIPRLQSVVNALSTSITAANEANATAFTDALTDLYAVLDLSPVNSFTPSQLEILKEIDGVDKTGTGLREIIQTTLDANNVTPANALSELQNVFEVVSHFGGVVTKVVDGFEDLDVPYDVLDPGESEIGVLIPWAVMHSNLTGLQSEVHHFDRALKMFGELVEDNPRSAEIRAVGSSLLQLFIASSPGVALCVATALERLCALYKQILEIKSLRLKLREQSLPEEATAPIEAHEQQMAKKQIEKIVDGLIQEFGKKHKDEERLNELRNGLQAALRFFGEQIDAGVDMEVRSEPPRAKDVAEEGDTKSPKAKRALEEARKISARIQRAGVAMRTLKRSGAPVLALAFSDKKTKQGGAKKSKPAR